MNFKLSLLISLFFIGYIGNAQIFVPKDEYEPEIRKSRYSLAICLVSSVNSSGVSYGIMRQKPDSTHEIIFLTESAFIRQASANEKSKANPNKVNYLEKYDINISLFNGLWKLKYDKNPYTDELGWGTSLGTPSKAQFKMLNKFGIYTLRDYAYGDNLWLFLRKLSDPTWVWQYQSLAGSN